MKKVYIILLNWNGWQDTVECLESILANRYENYQVVLCDNDSQDKSVEHIKAWAKGKMRLLEVADPGQKLCIDELKERLQRTLVLIQTGANLGFAGGNNVGIRFAMAQKNMDYIWLLNNDTVIAVDALCCLVDHMEEHKQVGMCGSKLMSYYERSIVQAVGGRYNRFWGTGKEIKNLPAASIDYVVGASMLVTRVFIQETGLMCEEYFLYFEELDWAIRAQGKFGLGTALDSIVYHKEGSSTGRKSELADYYSIRNRIRFSRKYYRKYLPFVYFGLLIAVFNRLRRRQFGRVAMIVRIAAEELFKILEI